VGLFRRRDETYNEQMLREAGLDPARVLGDPSPPQEPPPSPEPRKSLLDAVGVPHGVGVGPKEWDATVAVTAPGLDGDRIEFTTLPEGDIIVGEEQGETNLSDLADAVEEQLQPPYRAVAARQDGDLWGVGAKRIEVARIEFPEGDSLELSRKDSWDELRVDGESSDARIPRELEQLGQRVGGDFFVKAERIDGDLWEVRVSAL
jgi:hypothetical protein